MRTLRQMFLFGAVLLLIAGSKALAQKQWQYLGSVSLTGVHYMSNHSMTFDNNDVPHVAYVSGLNGVIVVKYNGSFWTGVGIGSTGISAGDASYVSMAFDHNNTPYVAYCDHANAQKLTVKKYTGTQWVVVGSTGFSAGQIQYTSLAIDNNNIPYVAYRDQANSGNATVMKFNGTSWTAVGGAGFTSSGAQMTSLAIDNNNVPYIAFLEGGKAAVMKFNGSSWAAVGNAGGLSGYVSGISIDIDGNNVPYIAYRDYSDNLKPTVLKYNGTNWVIVGSQGFASAITVSNDYKSIAISLDNNNVPYVAFNDQSNSAKATVMQYDGTGWVVVDKIGIAPYTPSFGVYLSLAFNSSNVPHVGFLHNSGFFTSTDFGVLRYDCPPQSSVSICAVITDTATDSNLVIWNGNGIQHVDSYRIYREDASSYQYIGAVAGNINYFRDLTAQPYVNSYKYKLTLLDSCGRESAIGTVQAHKSIQLTLDYLVNDTASLTWNSYQGLPNLTYRVKRSNNGGAFITVASFGISGSDTTYLDVNAPAGSNDYRIEIVLANACSIGSTTYGTITSNTVYSGNIGAVTTDTASGQNIIMWASVSIPYVDSFRVYREDAGSYVHIGSVPGSVNSFTDNTAIPAQQSYKYKVTILDINGQETGLDSSWAHKTMKLSYDHTQNNTAYIKWNSYGGITHPIYTVNRSNNGGAFIALGSFGIKGSDTTYADVNPPTGSNKYRIDMALPNSYMVGGNTYSMITSNIITTTFTGVSELTGNRLSIMPNPADNELNIVVAEAVQKIEIFGISGNKLVSKNGNGKTEAKIDVSALPAGLYLLRINGVHNTSFIKR